ncbi:MAG: signal recognition particle receptor subunit alpha, partial [Acidimicrobiia bacterium]
MDLIYLGVGFVVLLVLTGAYFYFRRPDRAGPVGTIEPVVSEDRKPPASIDGRLSKSRTALGGALRGVFGRSSLDIQFWEAMEEALIGADVGVAASAGVVERVRRARPETAASARELLEEELKAVFAHANRDLNLDGKPAVMLVVGVNGAGKTTSIAKLAGRLI